MGYFSYFVKCIIRNFAYKFSKPKVFLTVLLAVLILLVLRNVGYCTNEWSQDYINSVLDGLSSITSNQETSITLLGSVGADVSALKSELEFIQNQITSLYKNQLSIVNKITELSNLIDTLNKNILNIYNTLEDNQKQLINILEKNNEEIQAQLNDLKNLLIGGETEVQNVKLKQFFYGNLTPSIAGSGTYSITSSPVNVAFNSFIYTFEKGYTYEFVCTSASSAGSSRILGTMDNVVVGGNSFYLTYLYDGVVSNASFTFTPKKSGTMTIVVNNPTPLSGSIWTITKKASGSLSNINDSISKGNQLQQEQNDFIKKDTSDSDVSVDDFSNIDVSDVTSAGLTGIFNSVYNAISTWTSKDISLPIPYTKHSINIAANSTEKFLTSVGGQSLITIIQTIYYFIVSRFIVYSIKNIVNSIKSGGILSTNTKNDITTDML